MPDTRPSAFHVVGDVMQAVVIPLGAGQEIQAEPGALLYMAGDVEMDSSMRGGLWGGLKRMVGGESLFMTRFRSRSQGQVAFAAPHPGKLKQIDLAGGASWLCQRDSFLCATAGIEMGIAFTKKFGAGLFGGEGFILQRITGNGTAFIHGGGNFIEFDLVAGQTLRVDTGCIVAFEETVQYDIQFVGRLQERALRRGGAVPGHPVRPRQVRAADAPLLAPGRPDHGAHAGRHRWRGRRRRHAARHRQHLRRTRIGEAGGAYAAPGLGRPAVSASGRPGRRLTRRSSRSS